MARTKRPVGERCRWKEDPDGPWQTECGQSFQFETDGPKENKFHYCYHCGRPLKIDKADASDVD